MKKVSSNLQKKPQKWKCPSLILPLLLLLLPQMLSAQATVKTRVTGSANWSAPSTWIQLRAGSISFTTSGATVTGSSTAFLTELQQGDLIMSDATPGTVIGTVASIQSNTILTLTANAATAGSSVSFGRQAVPSSNDNVQIGNVNLSAAVNLTLDISAVVNSLTFITDARSNSLTHSSNQSLSVTNGVTLNQPTVATTVAWNINSGTATLGGNISFSGGTNSTSRICTLNLTDGVLNANGGISFTSSNNASKVINISGAATINLKGTLTVPSGTLNAGTSSNFNYCDASNTQTVALFPSGGYRHLFLNNTSANGAVLAGAITATKVTGNMSVASGSFSNSGFAIALNNGSNFSVANGATFTLTGTSAMVSGGGVTKTFAAGSTVEYGGSNQAVSNENYGNLTLSNSGTKSLPSTALNIAGNFTTAGSISFTANNSLNIGGSIILGNGTTANGGSYTHYIGGDWIYNGANLSGTATINFNGSGTQSIGGTTDPLFYNITISNSSGAIILSRNTGIAATLDMSAGSVIIPDSGVLINSTGATGSLTGSGTVKVTNASGGPDFAAQYKFGSKNTSALTIVYSAFGIQTVDALSYYNLSLEGNGNKVADGNITVNNALNVTTGTTLFLNNYVLNGTLASISGAGLVETQSASSTPLPTGKSWSPAVLFDRANGGQTIIAGDYSNLTINNASGSNSIAFPIVVSSLFTLGSVAAITTAPSITVIVNDISLGSSSIITINNGTLQIAGTISGGGAINAGNGKIELNGAAPQTIPPGLFTNNTVQDLTISNNAGATLAGAVNVSGILKLNNGNLNSNGYLTLLSTATQTALIDGNGNGDVLGSVTMQRYIPAAFGYRYFSSPCQASTVAEFSDDMDLTTTFPGFYRYNENLYSAGWEDYTDSTYTLEPFIGYAVQMGTSAIATVVDVSGTVNNGTLALNPIENNDRPYTQGFHLIGNPYPSPIDWDANAGWSKTNIDNAIYFFNPGGNDQYTGSYSSYINGVSSDGTANNIIASMQGFFVHVSNGTFPVTGSITINNDARTNNLLPVFHKSTGTNATLLRITVTGSGTDIVKDHLTIYFDPRATNNFDRTLEALKILNTDTTMPLIYALSSDHQKLSIAAVTDQSSKEVVVPLVLQQIGGNSMKLSAQVFGNLPVEHAFLLDAESGSYYDLSVEKTINLTIPPGNYTNRFYIVCTEKEKPVLTKENELTAFPNGQQISVVLDAITGSSGRLNLINTIGQVVNHETLSGYGVHAVHLPLANGVYIAVFESSNGIFRKKVLVTSAQ